jgi:hypothetical protein
MTHEIDEKRQDDQSPARVPGVCVTRRSLMNILVALPIAPAVPTVAPALPAGHDVAPPIAPDHRSHPDAELFELVEQFIAADRKYRELSACVDRMEADAIYARDPLPDVLRWRKSDLKLGLPILYNCPAIPKPNWDAPIQVNQIRTKKWIRVEREMIKGHPIKGMFNERMRVFTPSKAPRARADEIIATFDEWDKDRPLHAATKRPRESAQKLMTSPSVSRKEFSKHVRKLSTGYLRRSGLRTPAVSGDGTNFRRLKSWKSSISPRSADVVTRSQLETAEIYIREAQKRRMIGNAFARLDEYRNRESVSVLGPTAATETKREKVMEK